MSKLSKTGWWEGLGTRLQIAWPSIPALPKVKSLLSYIGSYGVLSVGGADNAPDVDGMQYHHRFAAISYLVQFLLEIKYQAEQKN